jgi:hypothetical protein
MRERGWIAMSAKDWGKGILPRTVNKQAGRAGEAPVGAGTHAQQPGAGKLVLEWRREENTGEEERPTSYVSCKQTWRLAGAAAPPSNQEQESL